MVLHRKVVHDFSSPGLVRGPWLGRLHSDFGRIGLPAIKAASCMSSVKMMLAASLACRLRVHKALELAVWIVADKLIREARAGGRGRGAGAGAGRQASRPAEAEGMYRDPKTKEPRSRSSGLGAAVRPSVKVTHLKHPEAMTINTTHCVTCGTITNSDAKSPWK